MEINWNPNRYNAGSLWEKRETGTDLKLSPVSRTILFAFTS